MIPMTPVAVVAARAVATPAVSFCVQKTFLVMAAATTTSCNFGGGTLSPAALDIASVMMTTPALLLMRGGGAAAADYPFDLTRVKVRLEGLHAYGVVTTLVLNASLRLFSAVPKPRGIVKGDDTSTNVARIFFTAAMVCTVLSGLFTTVVFSLLGMYVKTAIGLNKDVGAFFHATQSIRENAFHSFIISLVSFNSSFVSALFLSYEGNMKWWVAGIAAVASFAIWYQWREIMNIATAVIFS